MHARLPFLFFLLKLFFSSLEFLLFSHELSLPIGKLLLFSIELFPQLLKFFLMKLLHLSLWEWGYMTCMKDW